MHSFAHMMPSKSPELCTNKGNRLIIAPALSGGKGNEKIDPKLEKLQVNFSRVRE